MYNQRAKSISKFIGIVVVGGGILFQSCQVNELKDELKESEKTVQYLEEEQIINMDQKNALSEEIGVLEKDYRQSLEEIENFEESISEKNNKINSFKKSLEEKDKKIKKLEKDLISKKEREAKEAKLAKEESGVSEPTKKEVDNKEDEGIVTEKTVKPASSSSSSSAGNYEVTHYSAYDGTQSGITRGGTNMANGNIHTSDGYRIVAVDPNVIPFGSILEVSTGNGQTFTAKADDTGGAIRGNIIDIAVSSPEEARKLGRTTASVKVLK